MHAVIVIPTYNESKNISSLVEEISRMEINCDIIVVDDSSPDGTADLVAELARRNNRLHLIRRNGTRSFGGAYLDGFRFAFTLLPEFILQMDADLSHPPEYIPGLIENMDECDMAIGSRYVNGLRIINWSLKRLALSLFANRYIRFILHLPFEDCTSGYRCWRSSVLQEVYEKSTFSSNGYAFLVEMAYITYKKRFTIKEVPIVFVERTMGESKMSFKLMIESALLPWRLLLRKVQ